MSIITTQPHYNDEANAYVINVDQVGPGSITVIEVKIMMRRNESWEELALQLRKIADGLDVNPDLSGMEPGLGNQEVEP
jgi:hypothetical protein